MQFSMADVPLFDVMSKIVGHRWGHSRVASEVVCEGVALLIILVDLGDFGQIPGPT